MGHRVSRVYTRTGDKGETGLADGSRIEKSATRIGAIGAIDELNSQIGLLASCDLSQQICEILHRVQHELFDLGGELALPDTSVLKQANVERLEETLDAYNESLPPLKEFILPGGTPTAGHCHVARAVCRRAERQLAKLADKAFVNPHSLAYINRLSDLLFVLARILASNVGATEIPWKRDTVPDKE